jgi:hypothetical protein
LRYVVERYRGEAVTTGDDERLDVSRQLLGLIRPPDIEQHAAQAERGLFERSGIDLHALADAWLDVVRPIWYDHLRDHHRNRPLRLRDLRPALLGPHRLRTEQLRDLVANTRPVRPVDERVVASIIGVAGQTSPSANEVTYTRARSPTDSSWQGVAP